MKRMLRCSLFLLPSIASAQEDYVVQQTTEPYLELVSPTPCTFVEGFHQVVELANTNFSFFGASMPLEEDPLVWIGDYGFVRFDTPTRSVIIDGLFAYLTPIGTSSHVSYAVTGPSGARQLVAQWHNWEITNGPEGNYANWQIAVDEATGIVEIRFGPNSGGGVVYTSENGPQCGIFRANSSFTQCYDRVWFEQDGADPTIDQVANFDFDALESLPPPNTVYRMTPEALTGLPSVRAPQPIITVEGEHVHVCLPEGSADGTLRITDLGGRAVLDLPLRDVRSSVPLDVLSSGSYVATVYTGPAPVSKRFVRVR